MRVDSLVRAALGCNGICSWKPDPVALDWPNSESHAHSELPPRTFEWPSSRIKSTHFSFSPLKAQTEVWQFGQHCFRWQVRDCWADGPVSLRGWRAMDEADDGDVPGALPPLQLPDAGISSWLILCPLTSLLPPISYHKSAMYFAIGSKEASLIASWIYHPFSVYVSNSLSFVTHGVDHFISFLWLRTPNYLHWPWGELALASHRRAPEVQPECPFFPVTSMLAHPLQYVPVSS